MEVYTIYHIPGIKVGATSNWEERCRANKRTHGKDIAIEVLQITTSLDMADEMENVYSRELGYGEIPVHKRFKVRYSIGKSFIGSGNPMYNKKHTKESKDKMSASIKGTQVGSKNSNYGKGRVYKELTTGFAGTAHETMKRFDMKHGIGNILNSIKTNRPLQKGKFKGLHFVILDPTSLPL